MTIILTCDGISVAPLVLLVVPDLKQPGMFQTGLSAFRYIALRTTKAGVVLLRS